MSASLEPLTETGSHPSEYDSASLKDVKIPSNLSLDGDKPTKDTHLPKIEDIAQKLTKVSIMSSPDSHLLNTPPKDISTKISCRLHPQILTKGVTHISRERTMDLHSQKRKEPRFIPYEPYKGCVKPIDCKKSKKSKIGVTADVVKQETDDITKAEINRSSEKVSICMEKE